MPPEERGYRMTYLPPLEELDVDGAVREAAEKVDGDTRASFLRKAGIGAGAVMGSGVLLGGLPAMASAATPKSDVDILNFALTLEYLEAAFYTEASAKGALSGKARAFSKVVGAHERAHVAFLRKALGSAAVKKPRFDFKGTTENQAKFLATAKVLEDTGVAAYAGQGPLLKTKAIVQAALSIHSVEARHAAWVRDILGGSGKNLPAPTAFDGAKTKAQILKAVQGTGFIVG
jgi:Ferritin-like domain